MFFRRSEPLSGSTWVELRGHSRVYAHALGRLVRKIPDMGMALFGLTMWPQWRIRRKEWSWHMRIAPSQRPIARRLRCRLLRALSEMQTGRKDQYFAQLDAEEWEIFESISRFLPRNWFSRLRSDLPGKNAPRTLVEIIDRDHQGAAILDVRKKVLPGWERLTAVASFNELTLMLCIALLTAAIEEE